MSQDSGRIRVLIAAKEREIRDQIRQMLTANERIDIAGAATDGQEAVQMVVQTRPDVAILRDNLPIFDALHAGEMITLAAPETKTLLVSDRKPAVDTLQKAMKSGLRDWVVYPFEGSSLMKSVLGLAELNSRRHSTEFQNATDPQKLPKVIGVTGGKGGVGKTTIATSLAVYLAKENPGKVALVDMYTQFGDVGLMLNLNPTKTLVDMVPLGDEIDLEVVEGHMVEHSSGIKVLVGSLTPQPLDAITPACVEHVLHVLKRAYTYIILDLPPILHATTLYVLSHAYRMILVTTLFDLPSVRDGKQLYDVVAGDYIPSEKIILVANRASRYDRMHTSDIEKAYGRPVDATIPNDSHLITTINRGVPFVTAYSRSPLSNAIATIAESIIDPSVTTPGSSSGNGKGDSDDSNHNAAKPVRIFGRRS